MPVITTRQRDLVTTSTALLGFTVALVLMLRHQDGLAKVAMLAPPYIMCAAVWMAPRPTTKRPRRMRLLFVIALSLGAFTTAIIAHIYNETDELLTLYLIVALIVTMGDLVWRAVRPPRTR